MSSRPPGSMRLIELAGIPVFVHWTLPAGGLCISAWAGMAFPAAAYYCLAYSFLIALHELGHAAAARRMRVKVHSIEISGVGGKCRFDPPPTRRAAVLICAGGLLAQLCLLLVTVLVVKAFGPPQTLFALCLFSTFTVVNVGIIVLNIIPYKVKGGVATDGFLLWALLRQVLRKTPYAFPDTSHTYPRNTRLIAIDGFRPDGFSSGIEILNDNTTPMEFVVAVLTVHLQLTQKDAIALMLSIHTKGGVVVPTPSFEHAKNVAAAITAQAQAQGHPLACRAVEAAPAARASGVAD